MGRPLGSKNKVKSSTTLEETQPSPTTAKLEELISALTAENKELHEKNYSLEKKITDLELRLKTARKRLGAMEEGLT